MLNLRKKIILTVLGAALTGTFVSATHAEGVIPTPEERWTAARAAEARGDYVTMVRILLPLAEKDDLAAQYHVGLMYDTGQAGRKDHAEAAKWYRKAADQGFARAQFYLASIYYEDKNLQDYGEAMKWFRRAADQGTAMAQYTLGIMYAKGQGTAQDFAEAYKWFSLSASLLPASGTSHKQNALRARDAAAGKLTPEQIAEAQKQVREWQKTEERPPPKVGVADQ
jgi:TPR repeat protein